MQVATIAAVCSALTFTVAALAQSDRGTINGTVSDPQAAVVPNASVEARNTETGLQYRTLCTATGNYTLASLPAGVYNLTVDASGFKRFIQAGIHVEVAQTERIDVTLAIGASTESVTVSADAPLLKTDSGEQSHNITSARINALPVNYGARGTGGELRDPYAFIEIEPGATAVFNAQGKATSGFGYINTGTTYSPPRTGQLVARFQW